MGKNILDRFGFRQYINNTARPGECWEHNVVIEFYGNVDAAIGNSFVEWGCRRQSQQPMVSGIASYHAMQGDRGAVIDPENILREVVAEIGHEAARRCRALPRAYGRQFPAADARDGFVAAGRAQECECSAVQSPAFVEDEHFRLDLVDDYEGQAVVIA